MHIENNNQKYFFLLSIFLIVFVLHYTLISYGFNLNNSRLKDTNSNTINENIMQVKLVKEIPKVKPEIKPEIIPHIVKVSQKIQPKLKTILVKTSLRKPSPNISINNTILEKSKVEKYYYTAEAKIIEDINPTTLTTSTKSADTTNMTSSIKQEVAPSNKLGETSTNLALPVEASEKKFTNKDGKFSGKIEYPDNARRDDEEGTVVLKILVGIDGKVKNVELVKSSSYFTLDNDAKNQVKNNKFTIKIKNDVAVEYYKTLTITFNL
jgi:TonB family protein